MSTCIVVLVTNALFRHIQPRISAHLIRHTFENPVSLSRLQVKGELGYYVAFRYSTCKEVPHSCDLCIQRSKNDVLEPSYAPFFGIFLEGHERPCQLQLKSFPRWPFSCPQHHGQGWWSCTTFDAVLLLRCVSWASLQYHIVLGCIGKSKEDHGRVLRYVHKHYTKACLSVYHLTG